MRTPIALITVAETVVFIRQAAAVWDDDEREDFVDFIAANPKVGDIVQGTGGVRKVRWSRAGTGKRGGTRVIYFYRDIRHPLYLLLVYAKAGKTDLNTAEKRKVRELVAHLKGEAK
jgi:hypothetical protein